MPTTIENPRKPIAGVYEDEEFKEAINHLFPIGKTDFFFCSDCNSYVNFCMHCNEFKCKCQKWHVMANLNFARFCHSCFIEVFGGTKND